jgi:hypothetical protein
MQAQNKKRTNDSRKADPMSEQAKTETAVIPVYIITSQSAIDAGFDQWVYTSLKDAMARIEQDVEALMPEEECDDSVEIKVRLWTQDQIDEIYTEQP